MALHESLGKVLGAFEYGTSFRRANDRDVFRTLVSLQIIVDAFYQWVFWPYDHHINLLFYAECLDSLKVIGFHIYVRATIACSGIARGNKKFLHAIALGNLPCESMLTSATASCLFLLLQIVLKILCDALVQMYTGMSFHVMSFTRVGKEIWLGACLDACIEER